MIPKWLTRIVGVAAVVVLAVAAAINAHGTGSGTDARSKMTIVAPAAAGGGWDLVAREAQRAMRSGGIVNNIQVVNIPGAAGTIGLSQVARMDGEATTMMVTGTVMLGGIALSSSDLSLEDLTPIARLAQDFQVIAVPDHSEYETLDDFIQDWKANPGSHPVGGGSAGGVDHMVAAALAREAGIDPADIQYSPYAGGGELTLSLLSTASGTPGVGISGFNDFRDLIETGRIRALAVVAPERFEGLDVPTIAEAGFPAVDIVNWRGFMAPPGITKEEQDLLIQLVTEMTETEDWQHAIEVNRWEEAFITGDEFGEFLVEEQDRITKLLKELGLT